MKNLLISQKLHKILSGKAKKNEDMADEDWEELDLEARASIMLCLERDVTFLVDGEKTTEAVWTKLESNFMTKTLTNRIYLKSKLYTCKMKEGLSIREYINKFDRCISNLKDIDEEVGDEDQTLLLLLSLPKSYENLVQTLMLVGDTFTMDETKTLLLADDLRKIAIGSMATSGDNEQAHGLFVRGGNSERGKNKGEKSRSSSRPLAEKKCFKCGERGHFKVNCPNKKVVWEKNKNNNTRKVQEKQEVGYAFEEGDNDDCYSVTCEREFSSMWILDSDCSYHMCPNKKWFTTYRSTEGGIVLMGNNYSCKTVGLGSIRIRMHDGVVRTLTDVRHVPELRKNALDSGGCKLVTSNGVMKVVRDSLIVTKGIHQGNLYALLGTTVTESAAVGSGGDLCECTRLWHRRLGHMSEKGLN